MKKTLRIISIVALSFIMFFSVNMENSNPIEAHATTVYVTKTGKHYFYHKGNKGLNRAKKIYRISLKKAKRRGLTLAATDYKPGKKVYHHKKKKVIHKRKHVVKKTSKKKVTHAVNANGALTSLKYKGHQVVIINNNKPKFSKSTLSKRKGAWQKYSNLDSRNRAVNADALLNKSLMPKSSREPLYINPTGWHNKKIKSGWLYNRCHLIGYQLTGKNNLPQNLITGTRSLNDPAMLKYENKVAKYLKSSSKHYVRYRVTPIFKKNNLLASGVHMQAQSIGSKKIKFNVYIFNREKGYQLNYATGTSKRAS